MRVSNPSRGNNPGREHRSQHVARTTDNHIPLPNPVLRPVCALPLTDQKQAEVFRTDISPPGPPWADAMILPHNPPSLPDRNIDWVDLKLKLNMNVCKSFAEYELGTVESPVTLV